jgi:hypothetical protein
MVDRKIELFCQLEIGLRRKNKLGESLSTTNDVLGEVYFFLFVFIR